MNKKQKKIRFKNPIIIFCWLIAALISSVMIIFIFIIISLICCYYILYERSVIEEDRQIIRNRWNKIIDGFKIKKETNKEAENNG